MKHKLASRKLWAAIITAVLNAVGARVGLTPDQLLPITGVAVSYIVGQGVVDAAKSKSNNTPK